jgi:phosphoribosylformylglycinamidine synthase
MKAYMARVDITLKPTVNDPQGNTIRDALHSLGFSEVGSVRAGKYMEIKVQAASKKKAGDQITEM